MLSHKQVELTNGSMHVVESGSNQNPAILFLHGWPEDWSAYEKLLGFAGKDMYALAVDLPGIGRSVMQNAPSTKKDIAACIHELVAALGLKDLTLVGHDIGGQVVFSYLAQYGTELKRAVIMDVATPGIKPWEDVIRNPYIWHFSFNAIPDLPETMVTGKERAYFDYFYDAITAHPESITSEARATYVEAYSTPSALATGFNWYRAFRQDTKDNGDIVAKANDIETPLLYIRGEREGGDIERYVAGFHEAGVKNVQTTVIPDSGHFAPEEQPEAVWKRIAVFVGE